VLRRTRIPTGADGLSHLHRAASSMEVLPSFPTFYCLRAVREQSFRYPDIPWNQVEPTWRKISRRLVVGKSVSESVRSLQRCATARS